MESDGISEVFDSLASGFEVVVRQALQEHGIRYGFESLSLNFSERDGGFTPDFPTNLRKYGKQVIIEPHGIAFLNKKFLRKLLRAKQQHPEVYIVLVVDCEEDYFRQKLLDFGINDKQQVCDEAWCILQDELGLTKKDMQVTYGMFADIMAEETHWKRVSASASSLEVISDHLEQLQESIMFDDAFMDLERRHEQIKHTVPK